MFFLSFGWFSHICKGKSKSLSKPVTYYCVLIDSRDKEIIKNRHPSDYATFLDADNVIYYDGLDYVAHDDLLPFESQVNILSPKIVGLVHGMYWLYLNWFAFNETS